MSLRLAEGYLSALFHEPGKVLACTEGTMPRYFFHHRVGDRMMWDGVGLDLPDLGVEPASDQVTALWVDAITGRVQPDQILVITNDIGQVLFVTAR